MPAKNRSLTNSAQSWYSAVNRSRVSSRASKSSRPFVPVPLTSSDDLDHVIAASRVTAVPIAIPAKHSLVRFELYDDGELRL